MSESGTTGIYGFTKITEDETKKEKFLRDVNSGLSFKKIELIPGVAKSVLPLPFPESTPAAPAFYKDNDTIASHEEEYPKYHEMIFPIVETIANVLNLQPPGPKAPPVMDPTEPIRMIIDAIQLPGFDIDFILEPDIFEYILENAQAFIDAAALLPEYEDLYDLIAAMPYLPFDIDDLEDKLKDIEFPAINLPDIDDPNIPFPVPPFIDVPTVALPILSIPNVGIVDLILKLTNAAINTIQSAIKKVVDKIKEFIAALKDGIPGIVDFIVSLIIDPILAAIEDFKSLLAQLGWLSTIGTIIKYTLGMMIISIITFILGPGLISTAVGNFLGIL